MTGRSYYHYWASASQWQDNSNLESKLGIVSRWQASSDEKGESRGEQHGWLNCARFGADAKVVLLPAKVYLYFKNPGDDSPVSSIAKEFPGTPSQWSESDPLWWMSIAIIIGIIFSYIVLYERNDRWKFFTYCKNVCWAFFANLDSKLDKSICILLNQYYWYYSFYTVFFYLI